jgi:dipeptidyl aminopeptidase/acylaminoacyl peptidase
MNTVDADDYLELATPSEPRVSPDGERIAFVRETARVAEPGAGESGDDDGESGDDDTEDELDPTDVEDVEATVYVARLGGDEVRRFTAEAGVDACPRWSPSGDRLAFASDRGDEPGSQLWVLPADGGEARRVTCVVGGASALAWGPEGERIAFLQSVSAEDRDEGRDLRVDEEYEPEDPDPRVVDRTVYRAAESYMDGRRPQVYVAHLDDDDVECVTTSDVDHTAPAWGADGALYYGAREPVDPDADPDDAVEFAIRRRDAESGDVATLVHDTGWDPRLAVATDGRVAYASSPNERGTLRQADVHVYDPETEVVAVVTDDLDRTLAADSDVQFGPGEDAVYVETPETGSVVVRRIPVESAGADELVADAREDAVVAGEDMHCSGFHAAEDVLAFAASEWDHPGDVFACTLRGAESTRLTSLNREYLANRAIVQPEAVVFDAGDATEFGADPSEKASTAGDATVQGWLFTPPELGADESAPLVVEVHGGPHVTWTPSGTMWHEFQTLAAAGFCVFACNPRGSTGYGEAFQAAIERDWGAVTGADVLAGVDAVRDRERVDGETFVAGGSFGGYMTAWLLAHTDAFDAGVPQRGVYDLASFYGSTDAAYKLVEWDWGTTPWDDLELLAEHSPAMHADDITAPTLVVHAENDYRVPIGGAELLYRGLRKHGTPTRLVQYPREGHELSRSGEPGHVVDRIRRIRDWFEGYATAFDATEPL